MQRLARRFQQAVKHSRSEQERRARSGRHRPNAWMWALEARVRRRADAALSAIESTGTVYAGERLHGVRITLKKLRYAAELLAEARTASGLANLSALKNAQDLFGRLHDLEVLTERARGEQASFSTPTLTAWRDLGTLVHALQDECRVLHARYIHQRTELLAIVNRISGAKRRIDAASRRLAG